MIYVTALLTMMLTGSACPVAEPAPIDSGFPPLSVGQEVVFTNTSERAQEFRWDFEHDFESVTVDSQAENGAWTFQVPGEYAVRLEVSNEVGCDIVIKTVQVIDPNAIFSDGFESGGTSSWDDSNP